MELDQLKNQWRKEMDTVEHYEGAMFSDLQKKVSRLGSFSLYEDVRDILLWLFVAFFFSFHWLLAENVIWLERLGLIIVLSTCFFIIVKTLKVRAEGRAEEWTLSARVAKEISRIEKKSRLLMQTATWYLVPLFAGAFLVPIGRLRDKTIAFSFDLQHLYYCLFCLAMAVVGYWWSCRVVKKHYNTVLVDLKKLQRELMEG